MARLKEKWHAELAEWRQRPLDDLEAVYMWVDGVYVKAGLEKEKAAILVVLAVLSDGSKVVVTAMPSYRESTESWSEVLRGLKERGLECPRLVIGDGRLGKLVTASIWLQSQMVALPRPKLQFTLGCCPWVALYNATGGENWDVNYNWLSDAPLGEWHGVTTNDDGRVIALGLGDKGLSGEIPPELGSLSNLTTLHLYGNELSGEIPPELGSLSNLTELWLMENELSGEIPAELGNLSNLTALGLSSNDLSGEIPAELGSLSNLIQLHLRYTNLSGEIPAELGSLSNLIQLHLRYTNLSGEIPPELGSLSNLTQLYLHGSHLSGCVPSSWEDQFNLDFSQLGGLPFC